MVKYFAAAILIVLFSMNLATSANALTFGNIAGRWCGKTSSATFTQSRITVVPFNKNPTVIYKISGYLYTDSSIQAYFFAGNGR